MLFGALNITLCRTVAAASTLRTRVELYADAACNKHNASSLRARPLMKPVRRRRCCRLRQSGLGVPMPVASQKGLCITHAVILRRWRLHDALEAERSAQLAPGQRAPGQSEACRACRRSSCVA